MSKLMDMIAELDKVEYAPAEQEAIAEAVVATANEAGEREVAIDELKAELEAAKLEAAEARQLVTEQEAVKVSADEEETVLTSYLEKVARAVSDVNAKMDTFGERLGAVELEGVVTPNPEVVARHDAPEVTPKVADERPLPQMTDEDIETARTTERGCIALWNRYMTDFKNSPLADVWDETFDGDPYRLQTVKMIQASSGSRPEFRPIN